MNHEKKFYVCDACGTEYPATIDFDITFRTLTFESNGKDHEYKLEICSHCLGSILDFIDSLEVKEG